MSGAQTEYCYVHFDILTCAVSDACDNMDGPGLPSHVDTLCCPAGLTLAEFGWSRVLPKHPTSLDKTLER